MNSGTRFLLLRKMSAPSRAMGMIVATTTLLLLAPAAYAKVRIPIPVQTGNEIFEVGPLPESLKETNQEMAEWKLGYMCDRFGIIGADVWTWNCRLVAYDGKMTYSDLSDEIRPQLEAEYPMSKAKRGWWNHYGIIGSFLALMALGALNASS